MILTTKLKQVFVVSKVSVAIVAIASLSLITGCSSDGRLKGGQTDTAVSLNQKNYKLIKASAQGKSSGFRLLGVLPIVSPTASGAKKSLYASVGEPLTGRAIALANQTEDRSSLYLILFSIPRITFTADVIEFVDTKSAN